MMCLVLRVSVLELPARWNGREAALADVDALLAQHPTDVALVPELSFTGYVSPRGDFDPSRFAEPLEGPTIAAVRTVCARRQTHLAVPLVLREDASVYNAMVVVAPDGAIRATYKKRHPWFPERWATPGASPPPLIEIGGLLVSVAVCYDGHFLAGDAADVLTEADLLLFASAWVDVEDSRMPLLSSLASSFGVTVANANWAPGVVVVPGQGGSCIVDERGEVVASVTPPSRRADVTLSRR
jgi:predicted amidohydrolase